VFLVECIGVGEMKRKELADSQPKANGFAQKPEMLVVLKDRLCTLKKNGLE